MSSPRSRLGLPGVGTWSGLAMLALLLLSWMSWLSVPTHAPARAAGLQGQQGIQAHDPRRDEDRGQPSANLEHGLRSSRLRHDAANPASLPQPHDTHSSSSLNPLQAPPELQLAGTVPLPVAPTLLRDPGLRCPRAQAPPLA